MKQRQIKQLRSIATQQVQQAKQSAQVTLNAVMWYMIKAQARQQAEQDEQEYDEDTDSILSVPCSEVKGVPKTFALNVSYDPETEMVLITASKQKPKSPIILPNMEN